MHPVEIPPEITERLLRRRGKVHVFEEIDPVRTALIVIDMQNAFMEPGMANEVPVAREIVPNINRLAAAFREAGSPVAWVQTALAGADGLRWAHFFEHIVGGEFAELLTEQLAEGSHGHQLWPALDVRPDDLLVGKNRFSALIHGASDLESRLRERGVDTLVIVGTLTNVCCESTGRDAMMLDFRTILVSDANATRSDAEHLASLINFIQVFGDVHPTDEVISMVGRATARTVPVPTPATPPAPPP